MLTKKEHQFLKYWEENRNHQKQKTKQFVVGLIIGLSIGLSILYLIFIGWYDRATMVANTRLSPILFLIIIISISVFIAYFYRNYKWDMYEQQYKELLFKRKKEQSNL